MWGWDKTPLPNPHEIMESGVSMSTRSYSAKKIALMGMLFALAMVFAFIESSLPALPALPVGVKLGLSNIVTMYCLFCLGVKEAFVLACLKSGFVFLTKGATGAMMSFSGGVFAIVVMALLLLPKRYRPSMLLVSAAGAVFHNIGQLSVAAILLRSMRTFYYLPVMVLSGVGMGLLTGVTLRVVLPYVSGLNQSR